MSAEVNPGLGWGTAAPVMFLVEAFRTTGDGRWLLAAREGVRWMDAHLDAAAAEWAGCGLLTGIGGWAIVLHELAAASDDEHASNLARRVLETVAHHASVTGQGVHWHDLTETSRVVHTHAGPFRQPEANTGAERSGSARYAPEPTWGL